MNTQSSVYPTGWSLFVLVQHSHMRNSWALSDRQALAHFAESFHFNYGRAKEREMEGLFILLRGPTYIIGERK